MKQPVRPFCKNRENLEKAPRHNWLVLSLITSVQMPTAILYRRLLTNYGDILLTTFDTSFQNLVFILTWHTSSWVDIFLYLPVRAGEWFQKTKLFWEKFLKFGNTLFEFKKVLNKNDTPCYETIEEKRSWTNEFWK